MNKNNIRFGHLRARLVQWKSSTEGGSLLRRRLTLRRQRRFIAGILLLVTAAGVDTIMFKNGLPIMSSSQAQNLDPAGSPEKVHLYTNLLINETSPYLLQHAHNPVNWHPWSDEAFAKAKRENKPIFLSVGYSTCYWCHVMEVESFEDPEVAAVINEHFVAIKVDREERPDIDEQYMTATQLITQRGGWPNSVWLTPEGKPWMAGTYFPKQHFISVLNQLNDFWKTRQDDVRRQAESLASTARQLSNPLFAEEVELTPQLVGKAVQGLVARFDKEHGGFGGAPKFPQHGTLQLLIQQYRQTADPSLLTAIAETLDAMWLGGIHDHIGGGFHRYSTDNQWLLPHFEKMLYDNAQLMRSYADAFEINGNQRYRDAVADIHSWVVREMTSPQGAFYSAIDSGEVGEEGEAYVWSVDRLQDALTADEAKLFAEIYNFQSTGNFKEEATGEPTGTNIPHLKQPVDSIASARGVDADSLKSQLAQIREKLLIHRQTWPQPHKDDKVLTSWNGLMIGSLAHAGRLFDEPKYIAAAQQAADFILNHMRRDGELLRTFRDSQAKLPGYLDDYAYFTKGLIDLYRATGDVRWLDHAEKLADRMIQNFEDPEDGGFYFTSTAHEDLMVRSKYLGGGGNIPSPNGVAAQVLIELSQLTDKPAYRDAARGTLQSLAGMMQQQPFASEDLLIATSLYYATDSQTGDAASKREEAQPLDGRVDQKVGPVTLRIATSEVKVAPGHTLIVTVKMEIGDGWHLYADNPEANFLQASGVVVDPNDALTIGVTEFPAADRRVDSVLKQPLNTYTGQIEFKIPVTVKEQATAGSTVLSVQVTTQACDDQRCLPATTSDFRLPIEITAPIDP